MEKVTTAPARPVVIRIRVWLELATFSLVAMELTWLVTYYFGLASRTISWVKIASILGVIILLSHLFARFLNFLRLPFKTRTILFVAWVLLAMFGSLKLLVLSGKPVSLFALIAHPFLAVASDENASFVEFWHLILVTVLIWRGVSLASTPVTVSRVLRSFQLGLLIFIGYGLVIGRLDPNTGYMILFAFLFFGILALASARIASVSDLRGGKTGRFSHDWMLGIVGFTFLLVAAGVLFGVLLQGPLSFTVVKLSTLILLILTVISLLITYPIVLLLTLLAPLLENLSFRMPELTVFKQIEEMFNKFANEETVNLSHLASAINTGRILGRIAVILAIILVVVLALRWRAMLARNQADEEVSDLPGALHWPSLPHFDPRKRLARLTGASRWLAAARIRRIYTELMSLAARLEHPRPQAVTPLEFLTTLGLVFPEDQTDLEQITGAYLKVRYGEYPETPEQVQTVVQAWERVRLSGRKSLALQEQLKKMKLPQ